MTKQTIFLFACLFLLIATPSAVRASEAGSQEKTHNSLTEKMRSGSEEFSKMTSKKTEKRLNRFFKKLERKAEKKGAQIDFTDPVDQWLWFGIFGLGIAIAFAILGLGTLAGLCALAAIVCLIIWLVKRGSV